MKFYHRFLLVFILLWAVQVQVQAFPPYYEISESAAAQQEARQRKLPLVWLGSDPECLSGTPFQVGSITDLTRISMTALKDNAVIIFFDGRDMTPVPNIVHAQFHIQDDGSLPNDAAWISPKMVFTNPDITKTLGRVSHTQLKQDLDVPINSALQVIRNDSTALDSVQPPDGAPSPGNAPATSSGMFSVLDIVGWTIDNSLYLAVGAVLLVGLVVLGAVFSRSSRPSDRD